MIRILTIAAACAVLAACTIAPTAAPGAPATTPQANIVKDRAMTGQTE